MYKILLIDSDQRSRDRMRRMLDWSRYGFALQADTNTMASALSLVKKPEYKVVLINFTSFHMNGLEVCEHIRKESQIPILLIGGTRDFQLVRKAMSLQVNDYIPEPIQSEDFIASLLAIKQNIEDQLSLKQNKAANGRKTPAFSRKSTADIIDEVKAYVENSINDNITLKEVSDNLHYNCSYLGQKFKDHESMTFHQYLLNRRMEKAKLLLEETDMKIYEVAYEVGYADLDWFYKKFKSHSGLSASEYRKRKKLELSNSY
ncbi:Response regulator receiver domain-containing protein [Evansella caseinilytica]|uniref:Response regulator receiver domain-containing protein n=1 Tax=Evansella caseinilytica TaxID=1503961 RepID=A0A1H3NT77_9BACI|nr:helix-turn-helix domain-containing protein [Evansella caseinilytica]SDY91900.1 Response regulator receiver domain-containing protein [Evansella caseinilytica]